MDCLDKVLRCAHLGAAKARTRLGGEVKLGRRRQQTEANREELAEESEEVEEAEVGWGGGDSS